MIACARPLMGHDKSKKMKKVNELAEKAANNVQEFIGAETSAAKQELSNANKQSAKR